MVYAVGLVNRYLMANAIFEQSEENITERSNKYKKNKKEQRLKKMTSKTIIEMLQIIETLYW